MDNLLSVIAIWLSINYGLPAKAAHPQIELVQGTTLTKLWIERVSKQEGVASGALMAETSFRKVRAFYDDRERTVYLADDWNLNSPRDLSILVHELVHHLQNVEKREFTCPAEREKLAYQAQDAWLGLFQTSLELEFEIDPFTLLVSTKCMH